MQLATKLNPIQLHLLKLFERFKTEGELNELKTVLSNYYAQKVDEESDKLWDEKHLSDESIDELLNMHLRTTRKWKF